jgi:hypothetical protein
VILLKYIPKPILILLKKNYNRERAVIPAKIKIRKIDRVCEEQPVC